MALFYPPLKPYPCGCTFGKLCDEHQAQADAQRKAVTAGKVEKALEIRKSVSRAREGKPFAFPTWDRMPRLRPPISTADCEHDWQYLKRQPGETYTGYCEQCSKCQAIRQIAQ